MRAHKNIGVFFAATAMIAANSVRRATPSLTRFGKGAVTQTDRDAIARAEAKRARKAAKLRGIQS